MQSNVLFQKIILRCGCFFHPDRPPVIHQVEIGKVVEKADLFQQHHLHRLRIPTRLYPVDIQTTA